MEEEKISRLQNLLDGSVVTKDELLSASKLADDLSLELGSLREENSRMRAYLAEIDRVIDRAIDLLNPRSTTPYNNSQTVHGMLCQLRRANKQRRET